MRGLGRLASNPNTSTSSKHSFFISSSLSTFSNGGDGSGRGRGRGRGSPSPISRVPGKPDTTDTDTDFIPTGIGHGRGKPFPSSPILPSFSSWMSPIRPSNGRGRSQHPDPPPEDSSTNLSKKPVFFRREDDVESPPKTQFSNSDQDPDGVFLPRSLFSDLGGAGRGKPMKLPDSDTRVVEENRHLRPRSGPGSPRRGGPTNAIEARENLSPPRMSREEAKKKAVGILERSGGGGTEEGGRGRGERGGRGRGGGRGMQGRRGRGRGYRGGGRGRFRDSEDDYASGLYLGDNADGERLAKRLGAEKMNELVEGFEELSWRVLPSPMDEAYLNALHTNNLIEYEPEYLMEEFGTNPDIDDTPPIPLRDALEKMKPFLMEYEGIQSQEEWEQVMKETMEKVPHMKQLIEIYSGPDRVTAKQQQQEMERVAKTLPDNIPSSVKRFTDRALLSLQSNPGWGFDKKCQFMDKMVWEVSQQYK